MHYQGNKARANTAPRFCHPAVQLCKVKSANADDVLAAVAHSLRLYIEDFELKVEGMPTVSEDVVAIQIKNLNKELKKTKRILDKLFDDYENEIYTANEFVERKAKHNERIESIKEQIAALEDSIPEKEEYEDKIRKLSDALAALEDPDAEPEDKNRFLKEIVDRIEFSRENGVEFILDVFLK
jgi:septal ring factor EnvC (AmiA/AmiB activator)